MDLTRNGESERMKGLVHCAILVPVSMAAGYNILTCLARPSWRLAISSAIYGALVAFECGQILRHAKDARQ